MKQKSKKVLITVGVSLVFLLAIPLYMVFGATSEKKCPAVDPWDHTVLLPNPNDCKTFFMCSNGVPILQRCPEGLHFNANLSVCDWPQNAGCEGGDKDIWVGYLNAPLPCQIVEVKECEIGFTIPNQIPYIGGLECKITYPKTTKFDGTSNACTPTGVEWHKCDYYRCTKNK